MMFETTFNQLWDCKDHLGNEDISEREEKYRKNVINLCKRIIDNYGDKDD